MKNLVLIGMPGSGKTKIGRMLSARLKMPLVDTDELVSARAGKTIPELFTQLGEAGFRALETQAVREAAALDGAVIATGGGVVLREENMAALAETGIIFFRDRDPAAIAGEDHKGRPLIGEDREKVFRLYTERIELYRKYARYIISHTDTVAEAESQIAAIYLEEAPKA